MKIQKRAVIILASMMVLGSSLAGCGGANKEEPAASGSNNQTPATAKANLSIMWWGSQERHDATVKATEKYTEAHPNITFTPQYTDWDGYWKKLPTLAASKTLPDILQMDATYIQEYAARGVLEDLSDMDLSDVIDSGVLENSKIGGKLYGVPLSYNGNGFVYNKPELEAAGVTLPVQDWTYDQFFAFAEEAAEKLPDGKYGIGDYTNYWDTYQAYQMAYDKGPVFVDGVTLNIDKELWYKFEELYVDFRARGVIPDAQTTFSMIENDPASDPLISGRVMTRGVPVGAVGALDSAVPGKLEIVNNPSGPSGGGWAQSTMYLSLSSTSKNKAAAKEFLKWFISDPEAGTLLGTTRGIPISKVIFESIKDNLTPGELLGVKMYDMAAPKAMPFSPAPSGWADFVKTYSDTMTEVMFNKKTLDEAYEIIMNKGKEVQDKISSQG
ncbi:extracellular solute-binding protein [Paenibacillus sp. MMS20-IR301]|uniref:ABC transporter substrate-binding protein n=1 Tax=Paenibacillus sp. MMS20-IR301 TaxID=2895946 RepID=UPI0028E5B07E|nr:extracellular solute-binding protein [Paenibacillus sp. MMS20-IR301]WNS43183.1 extracellular solute-binding protein [Paenibacillus sp. MMS20-IR301]